MRCQCDVLRLARRVKRAGASLRLAGAADGVLADQNRPAQNGETDQIEQDKGGAAVLAADVREFPYISEADRRSRQKPE